MPGQKYPDDFQTTPASEISAKIDALKKANAPANVVRYWQQTLENAGNTLLSLPPKTTPVAMKMAQIEAFCKHIDEDLNYVNSNIPTPDDCPDDSPLAPKWQQIMNLAAGKPHIAGHHLGAVRHYPSQNPVEAHSGTEIVEIIVTGPQASIDLEAYADDDLENYLDIHINPYEMIVQHAEDQTTILLKFSDIYE